ncbi:hypothetical protein [Sulfitobacter aestuariivivens]|uniref:hypothetical protein n=1 Tax=Sulfitobacter aestuariivivens TaxID=2766981 RepID=UPI00360AAC5A
MCFANGNDVTNVMVGGKMVLEDKRAVQVNEAAILKDAAVQAAQMIDRIGAADDLLLPPDFWGAERHDA